MLIKFFSLISILSINWFSLINEIRSVLIDDKFVLFEYLTKLLHCKSTLFKFEYLISILSKISYFFNTLDISFSIFSIPAIM